MLASAIAAKHPNTTIIASFPASGFDIYGQSGSKGWAGYHSHEHPDHLISLFHPFNKGNRGAPIIVDAEKRECRQGTLLRSFIAAFSSTQRSPDVLGFTASPSRHDKKHELLRTEAPRQYCGGSNTACFWCYLGADLLFGQEEGAQMIAMLANYNWMETDISINVTGGGSKVGSYTTFTAPTGLSSNTPGKQASTLVTKDVTGKDGVFTIKMGKLIVSVVVA
ncbi:hypothetical protein BJ875DRAFT_438249 [Amylocarpus encephaloides]|uniref:Uncharacterized protein n=1 Tax=Amylocarpus encephaloides TaxID=45428 RepID=A0A9P7YQ02_9HELO|nr:hypothetical protein BJ875DRAFT_438249 [Amylocarpus encephaloides]